MGDDMLTLETINKSFYLKEDVLYWADSKKNGYKDTPITHVDIGGYIAVKLAGKNYRAHKIIYQMHHNIEVLDPSIKIDHVDGNKLNNSKDNLVPRTISKEKLSKTSQYRGVCWRTSPGIWRATIKYNGKIVELGNFKNIEDAAEAYDLAQVKKDPTTSTLNFPEKLQKYLNHIAEHGDVIGNTSPRKRDIQSGHRHVTYTCNQQGFENWKGLIIKGENRYQKFFPYTQEGLEDAVKWRNETYLTVFGKQYSE